jgi:DNA-directed RNA polymerase subunit RPC12/RpoP
MDDISGDIRIEFGEPKNWPEPQASDQCGRLAKVQSHGWIEGVPDSAAYTILCPECGYRRIKAPSQSASDI